MADTKKCPICGGTIHNKVAGKYICSQCGNAISEEDVITESAPAKESESSYQEFNPVSSGTGGTSYESTAKEEKPPKAEKVKAEKVKKEKKKKEPKQKVYKPKSDFFEKITNLDFTLWWPVIAAGVAGLDFTVVFILMVIYKFKHMMLWGTLLGISAYLMTSLLLWPVFDKAGERPWKALLPVYSSYVLYEISGYNGWMFFLTLIPTVGQLLGCVLGALTSISLAKKFGKSPTWGILYLFVLWFAGWAMIAVTNMTYNKSAGHQKNMSPFQIF